MEQLEHPLISHAIRTGYLGKFSDDPEPSDVSDEEYIRILERRDAEKGH